MVPEGLETIWESSRQNSWTFALPLVLNIGTAVLVVLAIIPQRWLRWTLNVIAVLAMSYFSIEYASMEIEEKWRIRSEWVRANEDSLSEQDRFAVTIDGANRVLGPIVVGVSAAFGRAMLVLVSLAAARFVFIRIRKAYAEKFANEQEFPQNLVKSDSDLGNAYAPPNTMARPEKGP